MHIRVLLKLHRYMRNNKEYCKDGASKQYSFLCLGIRKPQRFTLWLGETICDLI